MDGLCHGKSVVKMDGLFSDGNWRLVVLRSLKNMTSSVGMIIETQYFWKKHVEVS